MAGEPILVVDDTPVNLKLTRLLLTHEGYAVRTAARAEEAIEMLGAFRPDLILADIRLPGMDGLELTRRIKRDPRTNGIKVVALTGFTKSDDQERALGAGCDAYLTRPIDTQVLATRIREVLDREPAQSDHLLPPPEAEAQATEELLRGPEVEELRRCFLNEGVVKTSQFLEGLDSEFDPHAVGSQVHRWVGSAGLLGHPEIAKLASRIDEMLRQPPFRASQLRPYLTRLLEMFTELRERAAVPVSDEIAEGLRGKRVALIGFTAECADSVCAALGQVQARPRLFEATDGPACRPIQECDLAIVHVRRETLDCSWLDPAVDLPAGTQLVLAGERRELLNLAPAVRCRAAELLADLWHDEEVLMRLHLALHRPIPAIAPLEADPVAAAPAPEVPVAVPPPQTILHPRVVLADDDGIVVTVVGSTMRNYGMTCQTATNGMDALRLVRETQPNVAVLDLNMPGMDGYEVLAAIRAEGLAVSVILLTAHQREGDILRGFQLGADDYLTKPFNPLELMARIKRLLRR